MVELSRHLLRFRSPVFRKTNSPYDRDFRELSHYSEMDKTLIIYTIFRELVTDENTCKVCKCDASTTKQVYFCKVNK